MRQRWASCYTIVAVIALALLAGSGCIGPAAKAEKDAPPRVRILHAPEGLRLAISSGQTLADDFKVVAWSVHGRNDAEQETFLRTDLLPREDGTWELPHVFPLQAGMGFDIEALAGGTQIAGREFVVRDYGRDDLPGLREQQVGAVYDSRFEQTTADGLLIESQRGTDAVGIDPSGKSTRLFSGRGSLTKAIGPLLLNVTISKIERTTIDGGLVQAQSLGSGSWRALAPAEGNGSLVSFRQRLDGTTEIPLPDGSTASALKYTTTLILNGTFSSNGTSRALRDPVYLIEWLDPATHQALWTRQRPARLESAESGEHVDGLPSLGGFVLPPPLLRGIVPTPTFEDDRLTLFVAGEAVTFRVSPQLWVPMQDRKVMAYSWEPESHYQAHLDASGEAGIAGLPLRWSVSNSTATHSWSSTGVLKSLRDSG